ncbi:MAG: DEAD/DEAH box helicase [Oscillospiraceae bacterium]
MRFKKAELEIRTRYISELEKKLSASFRDFKNNQKEIIEALLKGHDTIVRIKTGGGKSLCFQTPAMISQGVTIVISPLQALCNDQVENFNKKYCTDAVVDFNRQYVKDHPEAAELLSEMRPCAGFDLSVGELIKKDTEDNIDYKLLYLSPEMLSKPTYRKSLIDAAADGKLKINMIIFDEAHCLSEWGFNFRESYFQICSTINRLKKYQEIPIGVFSATLTPMNAAQLKLLLDMKKPKEFGICTGVSCIGAENDPISVKRDDLNIFILDCDAQTGKEDGGLSRLDHLILLLQNVSFKKCIIYCTTIRQVKFISDYLSEKLAEKDDNLSKGSISYHGKMYRSARLGAEYKYAGKNSGYNIIVATKAFGMGIDNSDVDLIIHFDIPESIETYYQEIGRAGRSADKEHNNNVILLYKLGSIENDGDDSDMSYCENSGTLMRTEAFVRRGIDTVNDVFSESPIIPRLKDSSKKALKSLSIKSFDVLKEYLSDNMKNEPIGSQQAAEYFGNDILKCFDNMVLYSCDQTIIDSYFNNAASEHGNDDTDKDLKRVINQINEIYINNTLLANEIRNFNWFYKPDEKGVIYNKGKVIAEKALLQTDDGRTVEGFRFYDRSTEWKKEIRNDSFILPRHIFDDSAFIYVRNSTLSGRKEFELRHHAQEMLRAALKNKETELSLKYVYIYTDVNKDNTDMKNKGLDFIIAAVYKVDEDIFKNILKEDPDNNSKDFLHILGHSENRSGDMQLGLAGEETETLINKYYEKENEDPSELKDDERAVSYTDKKINRLLSEKNIIELYEGLSNKKRKKDNYKYRITFAKGQRSNNICCTLWYGDGTAYADDPLTYFDMCVFDAVCTVWDNNIKQFYLNTIWELLSGNEDIRFSRNTIKDTIKKSIEKLQKLYIMITDTHNSPQTVDNSSSRLFLNAQKAEDKNGREFYEIKYCPRLWSYAIEAQEGQIARVPLYKLDGRRYLKWNYGLKNGCEKEFDEIFPEAIGYERIDFTEFALPLTVPEKAKEAEITLSYRTPKDETTDLTHESKTVYMVKSGDDSVVFNVWYNDGKKYTDDPLTVFDIKVTEAIGCYMERKTPAFFTTESIVDLLSKDPDVVFSDKNKEKQVTESLKKMRKLRIKITSQEESEIIIYGKKSTSKPSFVFFYKSNRYYRCSVMPALHRFLANRKKQKCLKIIEIMKESSILDPEYKCSIWKAVLHFHLAHRISIIKRKNKMNFISYDTLLRLMEDYLPETLKNGEQKDLLRKWCLSYMFLALLPKEENHEWRYKEYFNEKTHEPAGIVINKVRLNNGKE